MLNIISGVIGTSPGTGHVIEYAGSAIRALSMEGRMTVCNMSIEAGARAGIIAPDEITFAYLKDRPKAPNGEAWEKAVAYWRTLPSDEGAKYDKLVKLKAANIAPTVTWGTSPEDIAPITGVVPDPSAAKDESKKKSMQRALEYMGLTPGTKLSDVSIDKVFIGSCTNSRIEDLRRGTAGDCERTACGGEGSGAGGAGLGPRETAGGRRRPRPDFYRGGLRMARTGMLHVPGDE